MKSINSAALFTIVSFTALLCACSTEEVDPKIESADIAIYSGELNLNQSALIGKVTLIDNCLAVESDNMNIAYKLIINEGELERDPVQVSGNTLHLGDYVTFGGNELDFELSSGIQSGLFNLGECSTDGKFWIAGKLEQYTAETN